MSFATMSTSPSDMRPSRTARASNSASRAGNIRERMIVIVLTAVLLFLPRLPAVSAAAHAAVARTRGTIAEHESQKQQQSHQKLKGGPNKNEPTLVPPSPVPPSTPAPSLAPTPYVAPTPVEPTAVQCGVCSHPTSADGISTECSVANEEADCPSTTKDIYRCNRSNTDCAGLGDAACDGGPDKCRYVQTITVANACSEQLTACPTGTTAPVFPPSSSPTLAPITPPTAAPVLPPASSPTAQPIQPPPSATPPPPPPPPPPPTSGPTTITSLEESDNRMIAYLGNWQACPTPEQIAQYTHIVISFAVTYTWAPDKNQCRPDCSIGSPVPICDNLVRQDLVDQWRSMGKKVILSFGGAGMGGSWSGDVNDCWEYCYGKQQSVVDQLNTIVRAQNFDGIDIDYEYFYDTPAAQTFLHDVTVGLKTVLPPGQNIVTHAPMETDCQQGTAYYNILKNNAAYLDFLMPQYYNGYTRPALDGLSTTSGGPRPNALPHYNTLVDDVFSGDATRVIFGFCISDCSGTGSNASGEQAASVMTQLHTSHPCNGGAFFWVVNHDTNGSWSSEVNGAISSASSCDAGPTTPTVAPPPSPTSPPPTNLPPTKLPPTPTSPPPPPPPPTSELVASAEPRCGTSELDARERCGNTCAHSGDCLGGTACYATHLNYCSDPNFTPFQWIDPVPSTVWTRCGTSEVDARSFCKPTCNSDADCPIAGEHCWSLHQNYCGSQVAGDSRMLRGN